MDNRDKEEILKAVSNGFSEMEKHVDERFEAVDGRFDGLEYRLDVIEGKVNNQFDLRIDRLEDTVLVIKNKLGIR